MPSFTFEKISSPASRPTMAVIAPQGAVTKPRGVIVQLLDRLAETRMRREARAMQSESSFTEHDIKPQRSQNS